VPTVGAMADDEFVSKSADRIWEKVATGGVAPPPRYAHSAVMYENKMYIFGGERSAYTFNDIWTFDFATSTWEFVTPLTPLVPGARFDHSAAIAGGKMVIYGGRNANTLLADMWAFDFATSTWTMISEEVEAGMRFGHAATIPTGSTDMYVFGGYAEYGFSGAFFRCDTTMGKCFNITLGCDVPDVASTFLPAGLVHRYEHIALSDDQFVYIYGGASINEMLGFSSVYKYAVSECKWEELPIDGIPVGRYEHVAVLGDNGMFIHGGHAGGDYYSDTLYFPL